MVTVFRLILSLVEVTANSKLKTGRASRDQTLNEEFSLVHEVYLGWVHPMSHNANVLTIQNL